MHAYVLDRPGHGCVQEVPAPIPGALDVLIKVAIVGLCGTDVELFRGSMPYFRQGLARYPLRPGHEWAGTVVAVGAEVTRFSAGNRVTGDTFIGCGTCARCRSGRHHLCSLHVEVGVRGGKEGALADYLAMPETALYRLADSVSFEDAAFVEPGSCSLRGVSAAGIGPGSSTLIWGAGTLGLLAALFSQIRKAHVTVVTRRADQTRYVKSLGFQDVVDQAQLAGRRFDSVIDATGADAVPERALDHLLPGGRLVLLGVPSGPAGLPPNRLVQDDITVVGVLGGSAQIAETIQIIATGALNLQALVAARVHLRDVDTLLASGLRQAGAPAPKVQVVIAAQ